MRWMGIQLVYILAELSLRMWRGRRWSRTIAGRYTRLCTVHLMGMLCLNGALTRVLL